MHGANRMTSGAESHWRDCGGNCHTPNMFFAPHSLKVNKHHFNSKTLRLDYVPGQVPRVNSRNQVSYPGCIK